MTQRHVTVCGTENHQALTLRYFGQRVRTAKAASAFTRILQDKLMSDACFHLLLFELFLNAARCDDMLAVKLSLLL